MFWCFLQSKTSQINQNLVSFIYFFLFLNAVSSFLQTTFPAFYQTLGLNDSDLWLSFLQSSQCEQEIPSSISKKISLFQQVSFPNCETLQINVFSLIFFQYFLLLEIKNS